MIYEILYLSAIVPANLIVAQFGPGWSIVTAFVFIGLDLTSRDYLHRRWENENLWGKMLLLIAGGSIISYALNRNAGSIAIASFVAFAGAGMIDTLIYWLTRHKPYLWRVNLSNVGSAAIDSLLFPLLAFGFPLLWVVIVGQFLAKVFGGGLWAIALEMMTRVRVARAL